MTRIWIPTKHPITHSRVKTSPLSIRSYPDHTPAQSSYPNHIPAELVLAFSTNSWAKSKEDCISFPLTTDLLLVRLVFLYEVVSQDPFSFQDSDFNGHSELNSDTKKDDESYESFRKEEKERKGRVKST